MKIQVELQNVYHFKNNQHSYKEDGKFNYYQVEYEYRLIDNDTNIKLGVLSFQNGQFNLNYVACKDLWSLYGDASEGIIETIFHKIASCEEERGDIERYININLDDILDAINEYTTKLKAYLDNDKDKLKQILIVLSHKFIKNKPSYNFAKKNTMKTIS